MDDTALSVQVVQSFQHLPDYIAHLADGQALVVVLHNQLVQAAAEGLEHQTRVHPVHAAHSEVVHQPHDPLPLNVQRVRVADRLQEPDLVRSRLYVVRGTLHHLEGDVLLVPARKEAMKECC